MTQSRQNAGDKDGTGQQIGGRWKEQEFPEDPSVSLSADDATHEAAVEEAVQRLSDGILAEGWCSPEVARHHATQWIDDAVGYDMDPNTAADIYILRGSLRGARDFFPTIETLAAHEYTAPDIRYIYTLYDGKPSYEIEKVLNAGVTPDRIRELSELGAPVEKPDAAVALADYPDGDVVEWVNALRTNPELAKAVGGWDTVRRIRYRGQYGHQITPAEAAEYAAIGANVSYVVDVADHLTPDAAKAFAVASGRDINACFHYFEHNSKHPDQPVSADQVKAYGPKLAPVEIFELAQAGIDPKAARSIKAADGYLSAPEITQLTKSHITTGTEYKRWRDITAPIAGSRVGTGYASEANDFVREQQDRMARILEAKMSGVNADHASEYVRRGVHRPSLWMRLADAGVSDLGPWVEKINDATRRSAILVDDTQRRDSVQMSVRVISDFVKRGGTPERLSVLQRAGIPIDRVVDYVNSNDPWHDGETFRERILAAEQAEYEEGMWRRTPPEPWPFTAETYQQA